MTVRTLLRRLAVTCAATSVAVFAMITAGCATSAMDASVRQTLAPSGTLRIASITGPLYATKDAASGEVRGVAIDLGRGLGQKIGAPVQPVLYPNPAALLAGAKAGEWDVAFMGVTAERANTVDFSPAYMEVEQGYLVRSGVAVAAMGDIDRQGLRVGVIEGTAPDQLLSRTLKAATVVRVKTPGDLGGLLRAGQADALAATKTLLFGVQSANPGAQVLPERLLVEPIAMALPKGRDAAAAAALARYVEDAKRSGAVQGAIERAGLRGVVVAPAR